MMILVVPGQEDEERDAVIAAWTRRGHQVARLERFWQPPALEPKAVRLYGDMIFGLFLAEKFNLALVSPPDDLLLRVTPQWLGRGIQDVSLAEALALSYPVFVKSLVPKQFRAAVYPDAETLVQETEGLTSDTRVLVSEPVTFTNEVRCLILNDNVVSVSCYEGTADIDAAKTFAQEFVAAYPAAPTFVLDIGWIAGHGWAVIEVNATWGAGLNGCDAGKMAECLEVATRAQLPAPASGQ